MKTWRVDDVMTTEVISVAESAPYREIVDLLTRHRCSAVPVVDYFGRVIGMVSEADLLRKIEYAGADEPRPFEGRRRRGERIKASAQTAADLMTAPVVEAMRGTTIAAAARRMDQEKVKRLPVVDDLGRLIGIVSRSDLLKVHLRSDEDIHADVQASVLKPIILDGGIAVRTVVDAGVVTFTGQVDRWSTADIADRLTRLIPGVVEVVNKLDYQYDDRNQLHPRMGAVAG
ncbi:CBS domain-containing protein [Actinoplanes sp. NBC_00393]|uniref:CBS domain-containing protein n=2 Tax=unclassified Actinoplanes TaxID=2626549 RepID=UPI002E249377